MKKLKIVMAVLLLAVTVNAGIIFNNFNKTEAKAYEVLGWDLVDHSKHLDWDGTTNYMDAWLKGCAEWNKVKKVIRPDSWLWIEDLTISDYYEESDILGITYPAGQIKFNAFWFDNMVEEARQKTVMHELGHALGLAHNTTCQFSVMVQGCRRQTLLHKEDRDTFLWLYNNVY